MVFLGVIPFIIPLWHQPLSQAEQEEEDQDSMQGVAVVLRGLTGAQQARKLFRGVGGGGQNRCGIDPILGFSVNAPLMLGFLF